jgi:murein DD-endopeptidase MepM/ murein hydrolase activator NlpD
MILLVSISALTMIVLQSGARIKAVQNSKTTTDKIFSGTPGRVFYPVANRKIPNATDFCDQAYRNGIKGNGGAWLLPPGYWHTGVDMNVSGTAGDGDLGAPIYAIADGVVSFAGVGTGTSWGNIVCIEHKGFGVGSRYAHLSKILVTPGQSVQAGQLIGQMGKGYANKWLSHLHFDVYLLGKLPNASWWCTRFGSTTEVTNIFVDPAHFLEKFKALEPGAD